MIKSLSILTLSLAMAVSLQAEIKLPSIIGDNMVLQRDQENPIWGWCDKGQAVTVEIAGQKLSATAGDDGRWEAKVAPLKVNADGLTLTITAGEHKKEIKNILVGEVWICSGQSNMQWAINQSYDGDLTALTANHPNIRLISVPQVGTQELQNDFYGKWEAATSETVPNFSAVGFYFGRQLHQTLNVPIGLIDNAWGGSAAEAWVRRDVLEQDERFAELIDNWKKQEADYDFEAMMANWKKNVEKAKAAGKQAPRQPRNKMAGQHRPGNLYAGVLHPTIGYGIRGTIWYQGESNSGRAHEYRTLFPLMIQHWRDEWGQGDFPFYWVQLADFRDEQPAPAESTWAELREAQSMTLKLPNTGQAVIYDIGEGRDIHPRNKLDVGKRLARIALARDYGYEIAYKSPSYDSMAVMGKEVHVKIKDVGSRLHSFDTRHATGFVVAGEDKVWHNAQAMVVGTDTVKVWSDAEEAPVAVRYAWGDNPVANLRSWENLPVDPFRSDDWKVSTQPK
ncbi:MAG: sialate O-acetylesterase [Verrucomicrobiota bacterium]